MARARTLQLVEPLDSEQLNRVYSELLSPLAWDLGHIANFEELWLVRRAGGRPALDGRLGRLYDAIENPRASRNELPLLRGDDLLSYLETVRGRTLEVLEEVELDDTDDDLLRGGYLYEMLIAHERQHNETMLQLLQMVDGYEPSAHDPEPAREPVADGPESIEIPAGTYEVGAPGVAFAYDNERPRHEVELAAFRIDRTPVSNGEFAEFLAAEGGDPPMYWRRDGDGWIDSRFGRRDPVDPDRPVVHVDHHQATAFASWKGKRLPDELEWEVAAAGADPGRANLDQLAFGTAPAGAYADSPSDHGAVQMLGDVWEWTAGEFYAYPGFQAFPYPEYSEEFFDRGFRVLRGGSWATAREVIRPSFRNWDLAERRQIFAGFRCAEDTA